jgi:hypothetical protein
MPAPAPASQQLNMSSLISPLFSHFLALLKGIETYVLMECITIVAGRDGVLLQADSDYTGDMQSLASSVMRLANGVERLRDAVVQTRDPALGYDTELADLLRATFAAVHIADSIPQSAPENAQVEPGSPAHAPFPDPATSWQFVAGLEEIKAIVQANDAFSGLAQRYAVITSVSN